MDKDVYIFPDGRMRSKDASLYTGFSEGTLANWRVKGNGPRFIKRGNRVFYFKTDIDNWLMVAGHCLTTAQAQIRLTSLK
jgi:hypothetical protein